mgnify:CR=1 FL=1
MKNDLESRLPKAKQDLLKAKAQIYQVRGIFFRKLYPLVPYIGVTSQYENIKK